MPITPFHFGPGAALHAIAPRHVSFLAFCAANVLIDVESLHNLLRRRYPVHAFFHTYIGATLIALAMIATFWWLTRPRIVRRLPDLLGWKQLTLRQVGVGAALGAYSHVVLDSVMHADIQPWSPFSSQNPLLGAVPLSTLHWLCVGAGALGLVVLAVRRAR